uniref:Uncharacterized protein n=1 Tax=Anguilla anguilla TaxID=7936 RepID=A0A0E9SH14_ANGAN
MCCCRTDSLPHAHFRFYQIKTVEENEHSRLLCVWTGPVLPFKKDWVILISHAPLCH